MSKQEPVLTRTNKLRFVERETRRILQQWWEATPVINIGFGDIMVGESKGEWRDVPVEKEVEVSNERTNQRTS